MKDEMERQEIEKRDIETRLKQKLLAQAEKEKKLNEPHASNEAEEEQKSLYNDAPTYYQPTIVPQNPLSQDNQ